MSVVSAWAFGVLVAFVVNLNVFALPPKYPFGVDLTHPSDQLVIFSFTGCFILSENKKAILVEASVVSPTTLPRILWLPKYDACGELSEENGLPT